jgi:predicted DNA-binding transcriptional regulator AlpA
MNFREACDSLRHRDFKIVGWDQNPHLFTAEYVRICREIGEEIPEWERDIICRFIEACRVPGYLGLFKRWPTDTVDPVNYSNNISHDELLAISYLAWCFNQPWAKDIYRYGKSKWFVFESHTPEKTSLFEFFRFNLNRILDFRTFLKLCMGLEPSWIQEKLWIWRMLSRVKNPDKTNISGRILGWLQLEVILKEGTPDMIDAAEEYRERMQKDYPGGPRQILAGYFYREPNHPFGKFAPTTF